MAVPGNEAWVICGDPMTPDETVMNPETDPQCRIISDDPEGYVDYRIGQYWCSILWSAYPILTSQVTA